MTKGRVGPFSNYIGWEHELVPRCGKGVVNIITVIGDHEERYEVTCSLVAGHPGMHIGKRGDENVVYGERDLPPADKVVRLS